MCFKNPQELLEEINKKEQEDEGENEMEITWEVGLKESAEEMIKRKKNEKERKDLTPWENYLNEKKQKKKMKQQAKQNHDDGFVNSLNLSPGHTRKHCCGNIVSCQCFAMFPRVGKH
jgi:hypothetical protein